MKKIHTYSLDKLPKGKTNWDKVKHMTEEDINQAAISDPDIQPLTEKELSQFKRIFPPNRINVKRIREKLHLSQSAFASFFGISKRTLQEWEQGRCKPRGPARTLLALIGKDPLAIQRSLGGLHL